MDRGAEQLVRVPQRQVAVLQALAYKVPPGIGLVDHVIFKGMAEQEHRQQSKYRC